MILIDSNIWCYFFDSSSKEHKSVSKFVDKTLEKEEILTNTVVLIEVAHFLIKNLGPVIGRKKMDAFLDFPMRIVDFDYKQAKDSISLLCEYSTFGVGGRDSTLLAAMQRAKISRIATHDKAFKKVEWIDVIDPTH